MGDGWWVVGGGWSVVGCGWWVVCGGHDGGDTDAIRIPIRGVRQSEASRALLRHTMEGFVKLIMTLHQLRYN